MTPAALDEALWAPWAWVDGHWQPQVLLQVGRDGCWQHIEAGVTEPPAGTRVLQGALLPSLVNAHSHTFQRAMAGLAECREEGSDDFWSWREAMYGLALTLSPEALRAIAVQLYTELLQGGYTQVVEFHYLHHQPDGSPYPDELAMAWALADAAQQVGIGLTLLPVLYAHQGFGRRGLRPQQRRFAADAHWVWAAHQRIQAAGLPLVQAGVALHSLRAAHFGDITSLMALVGDNECPIHIHLAEQQGEVDDCVLATGQRPIEWLSSHQALDARWQLVHATHALPNEIDGLAATGAGVVLCPTTEANLGDGLPDLPGWLVAGVPLSVGSDSHVGRDWREELRWLEYGQRLLLRRRNVAANPPGQPSTATRLFEAMRAGSGPAAGMSSWGLRHGARADALLLDTEAHQLADVPPGRWLDVLVFGGAAAAWAGVWVAGVRRA
jgi:formimidoylglutamate deiminase